MTDRGRRVEALINGKSNMLKWGLMYRGNRRWALPFSAEAIRTPIWDHLAILMYRNAIPS